MLGHPSSSSRAGCPAWNRQQALGQSLSPAVRRGAPLKPRLSRADRMHRWPLRLTASALPGFSS
jgi:hypothetical protein